MLVLIVVLLLVLPITLTAELAGSTLRLRLSVCGLGLSFTPTLRRPTGEKQSFAPERLLLRLLRTARTRRLLRRYIHLRRLDVLIRLGLHDAAKTALLTGLVSQLAPLLPAPADVRITPDFSLRTRLGARCILSFRLGTIAIAAAPAFFSWIREKTERLYSGPREA